MDRAAQDRPRGVFGDQGHGPCKYVMGPLWVGTCVWA